MVNFISVEIHFNKQFNVLLNIISNERSESHEYMYRMTQR